MYIPKIFEIENKSELFELINHWSFGDLITTYQGELCVNHIPFVLDKSQNKLYGHLSINNPQLTLLEKSEDLVAVFKGAHCYISPNWYVSQEMVPTWNFESVQVRGQAKQVSNEKLLSILEQLTKKHEQQFNTPWEIKRISEPRLEAMMKVIVGFEIDITSIVGKSKLSQNRSVDDRTEVISNLKNQSDSQSHIIAAKIETQLL